MRILFISDNFPPEVNAPATRTYEHCREWVRLGAHVTVITCFPNFPHGRLYPGYKQRLYKKETVDGIHVIRIWTYITANKGVFMRTFDYISFGVGAFIGALFQKSDVIVGTSPQFFAAISARISAWFKRRPWVMEVRDIWPESIAAVGAISERRRLYRFLLRVETWLYRSANRIVVVTHAFKDNIIQKGVDPDKIVVIKNGVQRHLFQSPTEDAANGGWAFLIERFVVGYIGTHGMAHGLDFILSSIADAPENIHFLFIGDGAEKQKLVDMSREMALQNVTFHDPVSKDEIPKYIGLTDVALVPLKKSDTFKSVIPSKIFENAAMQKPILLGVEGESKDLIEAYEAGLAFEPENKADFLEKLTLLSQNQNLYDKLKQGCARLALDHDRSALARRMFDTLKSLVRNEH